MFCVFLFIPLFSSPIIAIPDCNPGFYPGPIAGFPNTYTCRTCPQHTCEEGITPTYRPNTCEYHCDSPQCSSDSDCPGNVCSQEGFCVECVSSPACYLGICSNNICCPSNQVGNPVIGVCVCDPSHSCAGGTRSFCGLSPLPPGIPMGEQTTLSSVPFPGHPLNELLFFCDVDADACPVVFGSTICDGSRPYCSEFGNDARCVECLEDNHCTDSATPYCINYWPSAMEQTKICAECRTNSHCAQDEICSQGTCIPDPCSDVECGLVNGVSCGVCTHPELCSENNQCALPATGSFTSPATNADFACVIEEHGLSSCQGELSWTTTNAQDVVVFNSSTAVEENILSTQDQGSITTTATLFEQTMFLRHGCDINNCLGTPNPLATRNFFATCSAELLPDADGRCVECITSNDCNQGLVCSENNRCVESTIELSLYYEDELVDEELFVCNTIEVFADCLVEPEGALDDITIISDSCTSLGTGLFSCSSPGEYLFTCYSQSHQTITTSKELTLKELPARVSGEIFDEEGFILSNQEVTIFSSREGQEEHSITTTTGSYSFDLTPGNYWFFARHESDTYSPTPIVYETLFCDTDTTVDFELTQEVQCSTPCIDSFGVCNYDCLGVGGCMLDNNFFEEYAAMLNENLSTDIFSEDVLIEELITRCEGAKPGYRREVPNAPGHYFVCCGSANADALNEPPCPEGYEEIDGYCHPICVEESDCPSGFNCQEGVCIPPNAPYTPDPQKPIMYYPEQEAVVTSDTRHLVQTTRIVNYYGLPVRMNVVVISE